MAGTRRLKVLQGRPAGELGCSAALKGRQMFPRRGVIDIREHRAPAVNGGRAACSHTVHTATPLAIPTRRGATVYHAALIVRRDGPKTIEECRGRRATWVQRDSAADYLVPRLHMAAQGLDVLRFFSRELFRFDFIRS